MVVVDIVLLVLAISLPSGHTVQFPKRFSADVDTKSGWGIVGCGGLDEVGRVTQDLNSTLWSRYVKTDGVHVKLQEVLITVPASTADPMTPEVTNLTKFAWNSNTDFEDCTYQLYHGQLPQFFGYPTTVLEKREVVQEVECEKWSNKDTAGPYDPYWAVWYPINAHPPHSVVLKAQYNYPPSRPHQFPVPGCSINYTFSNFNTDPIPPEKFTPPKQWLTNCINSDGGLRKSNLPDRQDGYICVSPSKNNSFSIALNTKPTHDVTIKLQPCGPSDYCINGARCKDCVRFSTTTLTFGPSNWSEFQTVGVTYLADGDSQFVFASPNYYLNNTYSTQFSTCACASGKCSNNCQMFCN